MNELETDLSRKKGCNELINTIQILFMGFYEVEVVDLKTGDTHWMRFYDDGCFIHYDKNKNVLENEFFTYNRNIKINERMKKFAEFRNCQIKENKWSYIETDW